jgi:small conductance mechanosensitive channel
MREIEFRRAIAWSQRAHSEGCAPMPVAGMRMPRTRHHSSKRSATYLLRTAFVLVTVHSGLFAPSAAAQTPNVPTTIEKPDDAPQAPEKVEVTPVARDEQIRERLSGIMDATRWFSDTTLEVRDGVVFLKGKTDNEDYRKWAEELALKTEGVAAVVNQIDVTTPEAWNFQPARDEFERLLRGVIRALPVALIAIVVLAFAALAGRVAHNLLCRMLKTRVQSNLLREVAARAAGAAIFLLGLYFVLRIAGLSRLAVTLIGGTGLIGLVLGIAFRDITENFLASLFLSFQNPFRSGDLVTIGDTTGFVERLTSRTTVLTNFNGNQVQIPNATVFKSVILNFNSNPNRRDDFLIGIGYNDPIPQAQEVALNVLKEHPAVLDDPEPMVLVDNLGASTVNLRVYFWSDTTKHGFFNVRSSVIRLVKRALQDADISLPDTAREIVFPRGVPVQMLDGQSATTANSDRARKPAEADEVVSPGERNLKSEAADIKEQGRKGWSPEEGENLLKNGSTASSEAKK